MYRGSNDKLQTLVIEELGGSAIRISLRGGCMPLQGASYPSTQRGGSYTALYSEYGFSAVTGLLFGETTMNFAWEVPYFSPADHQVEGLDAPSTPEQLYACFLELQRRGRTCQVSVGSIARIGVLREITPTPTSGYLIDPFTGALTQPGMNLEFVARWEWTAQGVPNAASDVVPSVDDVRSLLAKSSSALSSALSDEDPFAPDFLTSLKDGLGKLNAGIASVRTSLAKLGSFASAPARLANQALGTCRAAAALGRNLEQIMDDVATEYQIASQSASALLGARRAKGQAKAALTDIFSALADAIRALEQRRTRVVGVHPGQSLTDVAVKTFGSADRWREIAELNDIQGAVVPPNTFSLEVKGS